MSKDGPKSGRMTFGYQQARDAGLPYEAPASVAKLNLEKFLKRHPECRGRADKMLAEGRHADSILTGFREEGIEGRYCLRTFRKTDWTGPISDRYGTDLATLQLEAEHDIDLGVCGSAVIWELNTAGGWDEILAWPNA